MLRFRHWAPRRAMLLKFPSQAGQRTLQVASLSTHTAIERGIRRSKRSVGRSDRPVTSNRNTGTSFAPRRYDAQRKDDVSRKFGAPRQDRVVRAKYQASDIPRMARNLALGREAISKTTFRKGKRPPAPEKQRSMRDDAAETPRFRNRESTSRSRPSGMTQERSFGRDRQRDYESVTKSDKASGNSGAQAPASMPFTTPASEFLYGTSVVEAALVSNRRKLYKLYIYSAEKSLKGAQEKRILALAAQSQVAVQHVTGNTWLSLLDKMSSGRPHNGYCLEASPLKRPQATSLLPVELDAAGHATKFRFETGQMSREDREVNGYNQELQIRSTRPRRPFVLLLDGVIDTGNMGGILRSAHFLGADAVAISGSCGPLNAVTLKASAGAAESLPLLSVKDTTGFIDESKASGWKVFASVAPPKERKGAIQATERRHFTLDSLGSPLQESPCILMIGSEGEGLKRDLQRKADYTVSISSNCGSASTVDSLNVSVATGILAERFLRTGPNDGKAGDGSLW